MKLRLQSRSRVHFRSLALLLGLGCAGGLASVSGCTALLGDYEVDGSASSGSEGGLDVFVSDSPVTDSAVTDAGGGDSGDSGDAGCKVVSGGLDLDDAFTVSAGSSHTCAIRQDGALYCWGANNFGQLGVPQVAALSSSKPLKVIFPAALGTARITQVALSEQTSFAVDSQLRLWAWGENTSGLLAIGSADNNPHDVPAVVKTGTAANAPPLLVRKVAPHWYAACALAATGDPMCWGKNFAGELGVPPTAPALNVDSFVPVKAFSFADSPNANAILAVGTGSSATCYASGDVSAGMRCWGTAFGGLLLDTTAASAGVNYAAHTPIITAGGALPFVDVMYGTNYGAVLDKNGRIFTWGSTNNSQHGTGAPPAGTAKSLPGAWISMSTGYVFFCAVDDQKVVRCRGSNTQKQLGRVTASPAEDERMDPVVLANGQNFGNVRSVHAGFFHACAIVQGACGGKGPGQVKCWGQGDKGQLGDGTTGTSVVPVDVKAP